MNRVVFQVFKVTSEGTVGEEVARAVSIDGNLTTLWSMEDGLFKALKIWHERGFYYWTGSGVDTRLSHTTIHSGTRFFNEMAQLLRNLGLVATWIAGPGFTARLSSEKET